MEQAVVAQLLPVFDDEYLLGLAAAYLSEHANDDGHVGKRRREITTSLDGLHNEKTAIARREARAGNLDFLEDAVAEIEQEEAALSQELRDLDHRSQLHVDRDTLDDQLTAFAEKAKVKLSNLTTSEMAEFFDLIQLDLERVGDHRFEGTASIPIPPDGGEVWSEGPRKP